MYSEIKNLPKMNTEIFTYEEICKLSDINSNFYVKNNYLKSLTISKASDTSKLLLILFKDFDEWYWVTLLKPTITTLPIVGLDRHYKCDQMEGLIKCLTDIYGKII